MRPDPMLLDCTGCPSPSFRRIAACHALTTDSDPEGSWWPALVGPGKLIDTEKYFVICANVLVSACGSSGFNAADRMVLLVLLHRNQKCHDRVVEMAFFEDGRLGVVVKSVVSLGVRREKFLFFMNIICFFIVFYVDNCDIADGFRHVFGVL